MLCKLNPKEYHPLLLLRYEVNGTYLRMHFQTHFRLINLNVFFYIFFKNYQNRISLLVPIATGTWATASTAHRLWRHATAWRASTHLHWLLHHWLLHHLRLHHWPLLLHSCLTTARAASHWSTSLWTWCLTLVTIRHDALSWNTFWFRCGCCQGKILRRCRLITSTAS